MCWRTSMSAVLVAMLIMGSWREAAAAFSDAEWTKTIDVAGTQRELSQKMSKHFLLVATGINITANRADMASSVSLFDAGLTNLINGNNDLDILAAPSSLIQTELQKVLDLWTPFKAVLENNVDSIRDSTGQVDFTILEAVAPGNVALLTHSNIVVGLLVDAAKAAGSVARGLVVDIAGRQRMLIQRICKESLLVGLGFDVTTNLANLKSTTSLFGASHRGILTGAKWAGVPELTSMCTIQSMCQVSYRWRALKPFVDEILGADSNTESQAIASQSAETIIEICVPLFRSQDDAVKLIVDDDGSCNPLGGISGSEWTFLLKSAGEQRFLSQQVSQLFMQVANGVDVQQSKISLSITLATTSGLLQSLIEGSVVNQIPPPPTQAIADEMILVREAWLELDEELQAAVDSRKTDSLSVATIAHQSRTTLNAMDSATRLYQAAALGSLPTLASHVINKAARQRMLFQKISKEASLILYGQAATGNWFHLNASMDLFTSTHWVLLLGKLNDSDSPAINRTTNLCVIQQMKVVIDLYGELEQAAHQTASGSLVALAALSRLNSVASSAMNTAVGFYASGLASCEAHTISFAEWKGVIREIGHLRMLSQKASNEFLLVAFANYTRNTTSSYSNDLKATITEISLSLKKLMFGAGVHNIPAAPTQGMVDYVFTLDGMSSSFIEALEADDVSAVVSKSETMLEGTERVMTMLLEAAGKSDPTVPGHRMDIASRQLLLAQTIVKEALLLRLGFHRSRGERLDLAIASFVASQHILHYGGEGLQEVIRQRHDLFYQSYLVDGAWKEFLPQVQDVAEALSNDTAAMHATLLALVEVLDIAVVLYGVLDLYVPPEAPPPFPWLAIPVVIFVLAFLCSCALLAVWQSSSGRSIPCAAMIGRCCRSSGAKGLEETSI
ncbi:unnamed protein product [Polarella glacialis]|uniref:NarX-like N-terminal domain-containing protein n=1 Tax=Polarella glacialis TaxID=89957 RepID=A0A813IDB9_POLGL|nr:unnamed protein product [Polarella glacialis]